MDYNKIKGSKITAKNLHIKTRTPLAVKPKNSGIHHGSSHPNSEEGASQREAASSNGLGQGTFTTLGSPVYSTINAKGKGENVTPTEHLQGSLEVKKMKDANHGVFTMSMPAHVDVHISSNIN